MQARPILFSAPMVRAILREIERPGTGKTQTRRSLKIKGHKSFSEFGPSDTPGYDWHFRDAGKRWHDLRKAELRPRLAYAVGDVLWVRETCSALEAHDGLDCIRYEADQVWLPIENTRAAAEKWVDLHHYAKKRGAMVPSIHMPRWASRITLEVTDVRVERLQDISEADAIAEGIEDVSREVSPGDKSLRFWRRYRDGGWNAYVDCPIGSYASLWTEINGTGAWEADPWVVAVTFRPHLINVDAFIA